MGQGRRRSLDDEPADRQGAARAADHLPRPFAGLVPRPRIRRRAFGCACRRRLFRLERQAAGDCDARAPDRARGAAQARQARQEPAHRPDVVRRLQQAVSAGAHRSSTGSRATRTKSTPMSPIPTAVSRSRTSSPSTCSTRRPASLRQSVWRASARTCRSTFFPASAIRSAPTSRASSTRVKRGLHRVDDPHLSGGAARDAERDQPRGGDARPASPGSTGSVSK